MSYITTKTEHGFNRYWYSITDDSKHRKLDCHVVIITTKEKEGDSLSFKLLTMATAASKECILKHVKRPAINNYLGNVTDHANDAKKESRDTYDQLLPPNRTEHNVKPRAVKFCDSFHLCNLTVTHASIAAFAQQTNVTMHSNHTSTMHSPFIWNWSLK